MDIPPHDDGPEKKKRRRGKRGGTGNRNRPSRRAWKELHFGYYVTQPAPVYLTAEERMAAEAAAA
eukprot:1425550-Prorocentrum_lima.AAC.1